MLLLFIKIFLYSIALRNLKLCYGCGGAVHNEVAERARLLLSSHKISENNDQISFYNKILADNISSLQAGSAFPDWGYGCFGFDQEAEVSHWTPFLVACIQHLKAKYPTPYDENAKVRL
ncbi:hypothetical protein BB561_004236 [Smittium simulii]|uniref:Uncharacterized protein n=1 Tax=Smittium simulii TaxID=133385 RepID=A0A2T9YHG7_9FUNG|nr:hypothetical protein BB561_004236 [Smittium simulii]